MTTDTFDENDPTLTDRGDDFVPTEDDATAGAADDQQDDGAAEREAAAAAKAKADQEAADTAAAAEEASKAAEAKPDDTKPRMVPHARFNEVNDNYRAEREQRLKLEEELARLRGESAATPKAEEKKPEQAPAFDFDAREDAYNEALLEGDTAKAKAIRSEIRTAERAEATRIAQESAQAERKAWEKAEAEAEQERTLASARESYAATVKTIFELHPQLDDQHADFDASLMGDVKDWRDLFISRGEKPGDALTKAVARVIPAKAAPAAEPAPAVKKAAQVERNLAADKQQPPEMGGIGERAKRVDYANLSESDFNKLSAEDKRKARGDFV